MHAVEYRDDSEFWRKRLEGKEFATLHRGYTKNTMTFKIERRKTVRRIIEIHLGELMRSVCLHGRDKAVDRFVDKREK